MQDKLIEAAQEVEGPFIVESEGRGCDKCGAGEFWNVVFKPEDVALSTAYGDKEEAEDLAEDLNNAFRKGVSSVRAHADLLALCQQQHEAVKRWRVHSIWIPAIGYSMGREADKIIAAYDALFPKAGGAK